MYSRIARGCWIASLLVIGPPGVLTSAAGQEKTLPKLAIFVEDSPAAQELVRQAQHLRSTNRLAESATVYQQIIEQYAQKLMATEPGLYTAATRWVRDALLADPQLLEAYRSVHEPQAQRELEQASTPQGDPNRLQHVVDRWALCHAGLEAALRWSTILLEEARATEAANVLDELDHHPDLKAEAPRWHLLQAAAGVFRPDANRHRNHLQALIELGEVSRLAQLKRWTDGLSPPTPVLTIDPLKTMPAAVLPESLAKPLWEVALPTAVPQFRESGTSRGHNRSGAGRGHFTMPLAHGEQLFVNDGRSVLAIDRRSGEVQWTFHSGKSLSRKMGQIQSSRYLPDQRAVAVDRQNVATVLGLVTIWPGRWNRSTSTTWLVCLNRSDGKPRWRVQPTDLDQRFGGAFFHGTPILTQGRLLVLIRRRNQMGGFQDAFVAALDIRSGRLIWKRHLSSMAGTNRYTLRTLTQILEAGGRLYIANQLGTVCCLDARSGTVLWLSVIGQNNHSMNLRFGSQPLTSWQISPPVLVEAGLIIPPYAPDMPVMLLDAESGRKLKELNSAEWMEALYLTQAAEHVLAIGQRVSLFDGKTLSPRWSRTLGTSSKSNPIGRAAVTRDRAIIPTLRSLVILNLDDGEIVADPDIETPGNVLVMDGQVVIGSGRKVSSYFDWEQAHLSLIRSIERSPTDPNLGMTMAEAALKAGEDNVVLEGVDHAVAALNRMPRNDAIEQRTSMFGRIKHLINSKHASSPELRQALFNRLATITTGPADEVVYHLKLASFLAQTGKFTGAVDHYQAILFDPTLSSQLYEEGRKARLAALEARLCLSKLLENQGRSIYAKYDVQAEQQFAELSQGTAREEALIALADRYPLSQAASTSRLAAAEGLARRGDQASAMTQLRMAYQQCRRPSLIGPIIGRLVELSESMGRSAQSRRWLDKLQRDHPGVQPWRRGKPLPVESWLRELAGQDAKAAPLPKLILPLRQPFLAPGRLLIPVAQPTQTWPRNHIVTVTDKSIQLLAGEHLQTRWCQPRPHGPIELLAFTDRDVLLWLQHSTLLSLDPSDGQLHWPSVNAVNLLAQTFDRQAPKDKARRLSVPPADSRRLLLSVSNDVICVAGQVGGSTKVVGIDRHQGQGLWHVRPPVDRIHSMQIGGGAVVLSGSNERPDTPNTIVVLDPRTGEDRFPPLENQAPVLWLGPSAEGMLYEASQNQVTARHTSTGDIVWRLIMRSAFLTRRGLINCDLLALQDATGSVLMIDARTGELLNRLSGLVTGSNPMIQFHVVDQHWYFMSAQQLTAVAKDGQIVWRDAVTAFEKNFTLQLVGDQQIVALNAVSRTGTLPTSDHHYQLLLFDRASGRIADQVQLEAPGPIDGRRAVFLDNKLILSTPATTIVIPGSP